MLTTRSLHVYRRLVREGHREAETPHDGLDATEDIPVERTYRGHKNHDDLCTRCARCARGRCGVRAPQPRRSATLRQTSVMTGEERTVLLISVEDGSVKRWSISEEECIATVSVA